MNHRVSTHRYGRLVLVVVLAVGVVASAQTKIALDPNKYSLQQDVQLGQEAAAEARKQLPMLDDDRVDDYVEDVGESLVDAIPPEFRQFYLTFPGTVWRDRDGRRVPCLHWYGGRWYLDFCWLGGDWGSGDRLLRPRK